LYTLFQWTKALGINSDRARQWVNKGYIGPSVPAEGQGKAALFSVDNIVEASVFKALVDFGMARDAAAMVLFEMSGWQVINEEPARFVRVSFFSNSTVKTEFYWNRKGPEMLMERGAKLALIVNIEGVAETVRMALTGEQ